jgi:hypothetical protein
MVKKKSWRHEAVLDTDSTTTDRTLQLVSWVHLALMSPSGVAPTVPIMAEAAFVHFHGPMAMLEAGVSSHVALGVLAVVHVITMGAFDWGVHFPQRVCFP